jgi:hypothetical protein
LLDIEGTNEKVCCVHTDGLQPPGIIMRVSN